MNTSSSPCPACGRPLVPEARFCSQCGAACTPERVKWYYNAWFVLVMLAFVLGPFGLPLVWKHPRWSRTVKVLLTLGTLAYTVWLVDVTIRVARAVLQSFDAVNSTLGW